LKRRGWGWVELVSKAPDPRRGALLPLKGRPGEVVILNIHPQRWNDKPYDWAKELLLQNVKNMVKVALLKSK
jgi:hypothetical protein